MALVIPGIAVSIHRRYGPSQDCGSDTLVRRMQLVYSSIGLSLVVGAGQCYSEWRSGYTQHAYVGWKLNP